ncbi:MAG: hypothetical protein ABI559_13155 [Chloroflexota bacterium]
MARGIPLLAVSLLLALAISAFFLGNTTSAALNLTGDWKFTIAGDETGICTSTLTETGDNITGAFDCPSHHGQLDGTVKLQGQSHILDATVTLYNGSVVLDTWQVSAAVSAAGNNVSGHWDASSGESGTLDGARDVPVYIKGDLNCDGSVNSRDVLAGVRDSLGLDPMQQPDCPQIGANIGVIFGDLDCNGKAEIDDDFLLLRYAAELATAPPSSCLAIGEEYSPAPK